MKAIASRANPSPSLWLPGLLLCSLLALIAVQSGLVPFPAAGATIERPETIIVPPRSFSSRLAGEFVRDRVPVDAPMATIERDRPIEIMKFQVGVFDYARCVADGACEAAAPRRKADGDVPVTGVNFNDAKDYARWLSAQTGETWRLPTVEEWAFAAGSRLVDHALGIETDSANPAERWIATYEREAALGAAASAKPEPRGAFGENELGVADLGGSVWEWTATCDGRTTLGIDGGVLTHIESCGVRILEGRHRAPMSAFIRDGRSGGCSVGTPPDNLGFRLVRERPWYAPLAELARRITG